MSATIHQFRIAVKQDREAILLFLKHYWNENHIYLKSDVLFDYDFIIDEHINFLLAVNQENEIDGILGFIQYSPEFQNSDICTVLWKVKPKTGNPSLGMTLLTTLIENFGFRVVSTVGANARTLAIYEFLGYSVGQLAHYFILNDKLGVYSVIENPPGLVSSGHEALNTRKLIRYQTYEELASDFDIRRYSQYAPFKSPWYIDKRYFHHPFYQYHVFGISDGHSVSSIIIAREIYVNNSKILRVIDFIGDASGLEFISGSLREVLYENDYEYVDFYQYGISNDIMEKSGFLLKNNYDDIVIPNYFEPFESCNVDINFFTAQPHNFRIFKGDGDQDRPNILI